MIVIVLPVVQEINKVLKEKKNSVLFNFGHTRRWNQCAVFILYSKISTDPSLLKIRHSHRFVAVVIQILIPLERDRRAKRLLLLIQILLISKVH